MDNSARSGRRELRDQVPERGIDLLHRALAALQASLPPTWQCQIEIERRRADVGFDALVQLTAPDGSTATLAVEAKKLIATREVTAHVAQLHSSMTAAGLSEAAPMLVARYLAPSTRERLEREGVAYADATGNLRVALERPALFVRNVGLDRDPWRGPGRPRGTLKGAPSARVVRALIDFSPPYTIPKLVQLSSTSTGATYRVIELLEQEDLLQRKVRGPITDVAWRKLIERWSQDAGFQHSEVVQPYLYPRGIDAIPQALRDLDDHSYVLTGSLAAQAYAPYAPPRLAMLYTTDIQQTATRLGLRPVERGANVLLAANSNETSFIRAKPINDIITAAPSQIAVDLLTGPGRLPTEGHFLLDWMQTHEQHWRH